MKPLNDIPWISPIAENIWLVQGPHQSRFPHCNGFLLTGDATVLIDAGIGEAHIREIDRHIPIDILIISHSHPDHILAWHALADRQLYIPAQTPDAVQDLVKLGQRFVAGEEGAAYWTKIARKLGIRDMRAPDQRFDDGQILDFGSVQLQAIHAPGHIDDHYCFLETNSGTLFSTDIDFTGFGPWYGNPEGDIERFRQSVEMVRELPFQRACSSHKLPLEGSETDEAFDSFLAAFDRQRELVFDLCKPGVDLETLVGQSPFYRGRLPDANFQRIFETQMVRKNLGLLMDSGRIVEKGGRYCWA